MATSVKMAADTKSRLEELQAEIKLETGTKVTQQELLGRLVDHAFDSREAFIDSVRDDDWEGLAEEEIGRFLSGATASGDPVDEREIDDVLYGSPDEFEDHDQRVSSSTRVSGMPTTTGMRPATTLGRRPSERC